MMFKIQNIQMKCKDLLRKDNAPIKSNKEKKLAYLLALTYSVMPLFII